MTYVAHPASASPETESFSYSAAQSPLPTPARANTIVMAVKRVCAAAQTDVLMSANRQALTLVIKNDITSVGALTLTPNTGETVDGLSTFVLQPDDAVTLFNTSTTSWVII